MHQRVYIRHIALRATWTLLLVLGLAAGCDVVNVVINQAKVRGPPLIKKIGLMQSGFLPSDMYTLGGYKDLALLRPHSVIYDLYMGENGTNTFWVWDGAKFRVAQSNKILVNKNWPSGNTLVYDTSSFTRIIDETINKGNTQVHLHLAYRPYASYATGPWDSNSKSQDVEFTFPDPLSDMKAAASKLSASWVDKISSWGAWNEPEIFSKNWDWLARYSSIYTAVAKTLQDGSHRLASMGGPAVAWDVYDMDKLIMNARKANPGNVPLDYLSYHTINPGEGEEGGDPINAAFNWRLGWIRNALAPNGNSPGYLEPSSEIHVNEFIVWGWPFDINYNCGNCLLTPAQCDSLDTVMNARGSTGAATATARVYDIAAPPSVGTGGAVGNTSTWQPLRLAGPSSGMLAYRKASAKGIFDISLLSDMGDEGAVLDKSDGISTQQTDKPLNINECRARIWVKRLNSYRTAGRMAEMANRLMEATDVSVLHLAQYINKDIGLLTLDWKKTGGWHALRFFARLPARRTEGTLSPSSSSLGYMSASSRDECSAGLMMWRREGSGCTNANWRMIGLPSEFDLTVTVYVINEGYTPTTSTEAPKAFGPRTYGKGTHGGMLTSTAPVYLPGNGAAYVHVSFGGCVKPALPSARVHRTYGYWPTRPSSGFGHFDRYTWTAYLSPERAGAVAITGAMAFFHANSLTQKLRFRFNLLRGPGPEIVSKNDRLGVRIDYRVSGSYDHLRSLVLYQNTHDKPIDVSGLEFYGAKSNVPECRMYAVNLRNYVFDPRDAAWGFLPYQSTTAWEGKVILTFFYRTATRGGVITQAIVHPA